MVCNLSCAFYMCYNGVASWTTKPVTTSIENTAAPVKDLTYPSVTTCRAIPFYKSSWEVPSLIFNSLKFNDDKDPNALAARKTFDKFLGNVTKHILDSEIAGQSGTLVWNGIEYPGTFVLPSGYNGIDEDLLLTFDVVYCSLALKIEEDIANGIYTMADVINIWTNATIYGVSFTVDDLAKEFKVEISFQDFDWSHFFESGSCNVDYFKTMAFLSKVYYFDFKSFFFENFGTSMEQLGDEGRLWIMSRTAGWHPVIDPLDGEHTWVSVFHFVNWIASLCHQQ